MPKDVQVKQSKEPLMPSKEASELIISETPKPKVEKKKNKSEMIQDVVNKTLALHLKSKQTQHNKLDQASALLKAKKEVKNVNVAKRLGHSNNKTISKP